jgi:hypothetical protein
MMACTALCFDEGAEVISNVNANATNPITTCYDSFFDYTDHHARDTLQWNLIKHPNARISQSTLTMDDISRLLTYKELGKGSFGAAYTCRFGSTATPTVTPIDQWVIKLPNPLMLSNLPDQVQNAFQNNVGVPIVRLLIRPSTHSDYVTRHTRALEDFRTEFQNAEAILEPQCMHHHRLRDYYTYVAHTTNPPLLIGHPLLRMSPVAYFDYLQCLYLMRRHPGYTHLHRVVHLDESVPALISEYAAGSLRGLQEDIIRGTRPIELLSLVENASGGPADPFYTPSTLWVQVARQMAMAIDYMQAHTPLAHMVHVIVVVVVVVVVVVTANALTVRGVTAGPQTRKRALQAGRRSHALRLHPLPPFRLWPLLSKIRVLPPSGTGPFPLYARHPDF